MEEENKKKEETGNGPQIKEVHHHHYKKQGSFWSRLIWGLVIIFIGVMLLGQNAGFLPSFNAGAFFGAFWPIFIIFAGLSILSRGNWVLGLISTLIALAIFALLFLWAMGVPVLGTAIKTDGDIQNHQISIERNQLANAAQIQVHFGAGKLNVSGATTSAAELVSGELKSNFLQPKISTKLDGTIQKVLVEPEGFREKPGGWWVGHYTNELDLNLDNSLPIGLSVDAGASDINIDLREATISSLNLRAGASDMNIFLGDKSDQSEISISSGASSITVNLPRSVAARINMKGGLSSKNFTEFTEVSQGVWESQNYSSSPKKVNMNIEAGVSNVTVNWR